MLQNKKMLFKVLGHSGMFALIPFLMVVVYGLIMVLQDGNLHSFYQTLILTGLFLFFTLNRGIVSFINEFAVMALDGNCIHSDNALITVIAQGDIRGC